MALLTGVEAPTPDCVEELLLAWRHSQREAADAYACWHELRPRHGHAAYLAALDREERAAGVYSEVRRRALERRDERGAAHRRAAGRVALPGGRAGAVST